MARALWLMFRTGAPRGLYWKYFLSRRQRRKFESLGGETDRFKEYSKTLDFTADYFTRNIPEWLHTFERLGLGSSGPWRALEIGSFEGMSSCFLLSRFHDVELVCVDAWRTNEKNLGPENFPTERERRFDRNLQDFGKRYEKFRGSSYSFFCEHDEPETFDFIYVDASHFADDVLIDALKSFERLKVGGVMIFDDYFWWHFDRESDNTCGGINAFLRLKKDYVEILYVGYQIHVRKMVHRFD